MRNEILEAVRPQIEKIKRTQVIFMVVETVLIVGGFIAFYYAMTSAPSFF